MPDTPIRIQELPPQDVGDAEIVPLPMTAEDRQRVRRRLRADDGQAFALMLSTGTVLRVGQAIYGNDQKAYVVTAALEDVLVVKPKDVPQAAKVGHLIGNLHRDIDVTDGQIITLWTAPLETRLKKEGFTVSREQRPFLGLPPGEHAHGSEGRGYEQRMEDVLPPRYRQVPASPVPMGSAELVYDDVGRVAWDRIWGSFCDLALAGGPTHRGTLLEPPTLNEVRAQPEAYKTVVAELERGVRLVTGLETVKSVSLGWVGVKCRDEAMAVWLLRAVIVENVTVRRQGNVLFLPAGPNYRLDKEIKNVVTVIAKTHHYFTEHLTAQG